MIKTARISPCGTYRYRLTRTWSDAAPLAFIMLNPSTADADIDDPTIRRCMGFAQREKAGGIVVVNLYALRSTNPEVLWTHPDPIGPDNMCALYDVSMMRIPIVCAWGNNARNAWSYGVTETFAMFSDRIVCLGKTANGSPRHPLYVRADAPLISFP